MVMVVLRGVAAGGLLLALTAPLPVAGQDASTPTAAGTEGADAAETAAVAPGATVLPGAPVTTIVEEKVVATVPLLERLKQGGVTMVFLLALSIGAVTFTLERLFRLRRGAINPAGLAAEAMVLWQGGRFDDLSGLCERHPSTLATIIASFVRHRHCSALELSTLAGDIAGRDMRGHLQKAYPLAVVATLSPLLGLLGTVIGMIESFEVVAIAGSLGDASLLAGGISKALVTTATGLVIAVPALGLYHYFKSRTAAYTMALEGEVNELLASWLMDAAVPEEV